MRPVLIALSLLALSACAAAPSGYAPASLSSSGAGYDDIRIESDRWRVSFTGAGSSSADEVERQALRRAGELALNHGFEWFEVVDRRVSQEGEDRSPVRVGGSVSRGWGSGGFSSSGVGIGISLSPAQRARQHVSLEIIAGSGDPRPERAYDAAALARPMGSPPP